MKKVRSAVNLFCYKHPRFGIPRLMTYIVAVTAIVYVVNMMDTTGTFLSLLYFLPDRVLKGELWRLITWIFIPLNSNVLWLAVSLYFYYFIGSTLERAWGSGKLTFYYLSGVVLNIVYSLVVYLIGIAVSGNSLSLLTYIIPSPVYLNLSLFFAFASLFPETRVMLFFFIPVKVKWLAWAGAAFYAYEIIRLLIGGLYFYALVPIVAVLNFLLICGVSFNNSRTARQHASAVNFKRKIHQEEARADFEYRHKCTVCGRTDKTNPDLAFRYCSRCEGFKCYCEDHIEDHRHI